MICQLVLAVRLPRFFPVFNGAPDDIKMVSLSTTLATNAVVEGVGGRVGLFFDRI